MSYVIFPVLKDDKFINVFISFRAGPSLNGQSGYSVWIMSGSEELQSLTLYPYRGDSNIRIVYGGGIATTKSGVPFIEIPIKDYLKQGGKGLSEISVESLKN